MYYMPDPSMLKCIYYIYITYCKPIFLNIILITTLTIFKSTLFCEDIHF